MNVKKFLGILLALVFTGIAGGAIMLVIISSNLEKMITVEDYQPLLVSEVYDREGAKVGEFFREVRELVAYDEIPAVVVNAFVAAEDAAFFEHGGINPVAIFRALIANIKAGRRVQGGSTITQQVARSLLLHRKKTYTRKIKEAILAYRMEANLTKQEILWLYLNQYYLGQGAHGISMATKTYFRKPLAQITLPEAAILAGLPQAPSRYSPTRNPSAAKTRQKYVLQRMADDGYITQEEADNAAAEPIQVYIRQNFKKIAPFYLETIRQMLIKNIGQEMVLDKGIKVYTGLDMNKQLEAQAQVRKGLRSLDKRQGFRGPIDNIQEPEAIAEFLLKTRNNLMDEMSPVRVIREDGTIVEKGPLNLTGQDEEGNPLPTIPTYVDVDKILKGVVTKVDDDWGIVYVRFAESKGLIDIETMNWARKPNSNKRWDFDKIKKPSEALAKGDIIEARVVGKRFFSTRLNKEIRDLKKAFKKKKSNKGKEWERPDSLPEFKEYAFLSLEQEPKAEAALLSIDQNTNDVVSMVGGYDFKRSKWNRTIQAKRQTGSAFKALVYAAALDKGFTAATPIIDAPVVFEEKDKNPEEEEENIQGDETAEGEEENIKRWKPTNHGKKFIGDVLFRKALIKSLNVPTVKIIEKIGVDWVADYARRLGIFSPLNMDYTLALGSSGVTLYEMTKTFSQIGRMGRRVKPIMIHKVEDRNGNVILENVSLDSYFEEQASKLEEMFEERRLNFLTYGDKSPPPKKDEEEKEEGEDAEQKIADGENPDEEDPDAEQESKRIYRKEPPLFFEDSDQLMKKTTAYLTTSLLQGVVEERGGTGGGARALGRPVAGKTGTTNGYYDGWFIGFTPDYSTGVWVGFDTEKTLGRGEVGGRAALPIWLEYMRVAHEGLPTRNFPVPDGIVFANIDNETGKLASASSKEVIKQAFAEGSEPKQSTDDTAPDEESNFYKEDLSE